MKQSGLLLCVLVLAMAHHCSAGYWIRAHGCIYLQVNLPAPVTYQFTPQSVECMYQAGLPGTVTGQAAGIYCVGLGGPENKDSSSGGDTCWTSQSWWSIGWSQLPNGAQSGEILSRWTEGSGPAITLWTDQDQNGHPNNANICMEAVNCADHDQNLSDGVDYYFIVNPTRPELAATIFASERQAEEFFLGDKIKRQ